MKYLDPRELNDLLDLAGRGGIGRGVALTDCVAEAPDQLMYIEGDELILLRDLGDVLLASCEGIIGWTERKNVRFDSLASTSTPPRLALELPPNQTGGATEARLPTTILTSPSPPSRPSPLPQHGLLSPSSVLGRDLSEAEQGDEIDLKHQSNRGYLKRISGPFELESPQASPALGKEQDGFFERQQDQPQQPQVTHEKIQHSSGSENDTSQKEQNRDSVMSSTSSEAFGGIGGFMMGGTDGDGPEGGSEYGNLTKDVEELKDERSPATPIIVTPHRTVPQQELPLSTSSNDHAPPFQEQDKGHTPGDTYGGETDEDEDRDFDNDNEEDEDDDAEEWDIYNDYARESMYGPAKRMSLAVQQRRLSRAAKAASRAPTPLTLNPKAPNGHGNVHGTGSDDDPTHLDSKGGRLEPTTEEFRLPSAERRLGSPLLSASPTPSQEEGEVMTIKEEDQTTPRLPSLPSPIIGEKSGFQKSEMPGNDIAKVSKNGDFIGANETGMERSVATELRLRIMREREQEKSQEIAHGGAVDQSNNAIDSSIAMTHKDESVTPKVPHKQRSPPSYSHGTPDDENATDASRHHDKQSTEGIHSSEESTMIFTPRPPEAVTFTAPSPSNSEQNLSKILNGVHAGGLLASPLPNDEEPEVKVSDTGIISAPTLVPRPPHAHSPNLSPHLNQAAWSPGSPSSPHSVAATRQAVDVGRSTLGGKRPRGLTLVGRMETDLLGSKGPVPITFLVDGPGMPVLPAPPLPTRDPIGLGLPSTHGRASPIITHEMSRASSPLASPIMPDDASNQASPFPPHPYPVRSATSPLPPSTPTTPTVDVSKPSPPMTNGRPRARSFSASVAKTLGVGKKDSSPSLSIDTSNNHLPPLPSLVSPIPSSATSTKRSFFGSRKTSPAPQTPPPQSPSGLSRASASGSTATVNMQATPATHHPNDSVPSLLPPSARSSSFSFNSKSSKTPRKGSRALPSPVSHKDFAEETVKAEGLDFELIQPRKTGLLSPIGDVPSSPSSDGHGHGHQADLARQPTTTSLNSASSLRPLPETDEWGFLKDKSPVPEIFQSRSAPGDHRVIEQKWLSIISTPIPANTQPPKKVKKLVLDAGVPSSLRGKVWAWFMANTLSARTPGLYQELIEHDNGSEDQRIDKDVTDAYPDHSIFCTPNSPGQMDLRSILRAYSNFAPAGYRPEMALIAGALLIHCVAEDSFWLLSGLVNTVLKDYFAKERTGVRIDAAVLAALVGAQEPKLAKLFKETGVHPISFVDKWFSQLFIRCLPWPTTLRVIDAVVSEGPRFLLVASLTILTLSRERLLSLPKNSTAILAYLQNFPQDSLLLPENFMKHCESVRFDEKEYRRMRGVVEKEIMG